MILLQTIFWTDNIQFWLWQDDIESQFSSYSWQKLVVEFKELSNNDEAKGKRNIEKLKTIIFEEKISVNKKYLQVYDIDNIAWFIMSSNNANALHLDQKEKGNRRFSIIHTGESIHPEVWARISETIRNKEIVGNFLAYLDRVYPETRDKKYFLALENDDKRNLEESNRSLGMQILDFIEEKYPDIRKIRKEAMDRILTEYENETKEHLWFRDTRFYRFLLREWWGRCERKVIDFYWKKERWYILNKPWSDGIL
jgi:hypothetical protein